MTSATSSTTPAVDQTYGQRSVFGGDGHATAPVDTDLDCEDEHEALAYLRLVRDEANKIPHVMVAPRPGPQALPPGFAAAAAAAAAAAKQAAPKNKKKRRRRRHWDEQDDGVGIGGALYSGGGGGDDGNNGNAAKKRRISRQQAVAVELSYDDEGAGEEEDEEEDEEEEGEEEEGGVSDDNENKGDQYEPEYTLQHRDLYQNSVGDARGYYQDGAYVAAPIEGGDDDDSGAGWPVPTSNGGAAAANEDHAVLDSAAPGRRAGPEAESARFSAAYRSRLLLTHFAELRAIFHPSAAGMGPDQLSAAVAALPPDHDTDVGPLSTRSGVFRRWLHLLRTTDPLPAQVAAMDKVSVLRLLRVLLRGLLAGGSTSSRSSRAGRFERKLLGGGGTTTNGLDMNGRTSRWLWVLFARLPDRGELDYREVGYIRDVAKQAVMRLAHLSYDMAGTDVQGGGDEVEGGEEEGEEEGEDEDVYQEETPGHSHGETNGDGGGHTHAGQDELDLDDVPMDMESASELGEIKDKDKDKNKGKGVDSHAKEEEEKDNAQEADEDGEMQQRATLEMVLAVAGEFYGQRDLLAFRSPWPAVPPG